MRQVSQVAIMPAGLGPDKRARSPFALKTLRCERGLNFALKTLRCERRIYFALNTAAPLSALQILGGMTLKAQRVECQRKEVAPTLS